MNSDLFELPDKKLRIFFSRRYVDRFRATALVDKLNTLGGERLEITTATVAEENDFNDTEYANLHRCHLLLLLITDEPAQWDCSLFDAGYSYAKDLKKNLFVIHSPNVSLPPPLRRLPAENKIRIDRGNGGEVENLLRRIYVDIPKSLHGSPINEGLFAGGRVFLNDLINTFLETAGGSRPPKKLMREIQITVDNQGLQADPDQIPLTAQVTGDREALKLFNLADRPGGYTWEKFESNLRKLPGWLKDRADRWVKSLANLMHDVFDDKYVPSPALPLYGYEDPRGDGDPRYKNIEVYRPAIHSAEYSSGRTTFRIVFTDMPTEIGASPVNDDLGQLAQMVDLGRMLYWGVVVRYDEAVREIEQEESLAEADCKRKLRKCFDNLRSWVLHIKAEAEAKGYNRDKAVMALADPTEREVVKETMVFWDGVFGNEFGNEEDKKTGNLKRAAEAGDLVVTRRLIGRMYDVTKTWLVVSSSGLSGQAQQMPGQLRGISYGEPTLKEKVETDDTDASPSAIVPTPSPRKSGFVRVLPERTEGT